MPQPRKHRDQAARQKAYRARLKAKREAAAAGVRPDAEVEPSFVDRIQKAGDDAIDQFFGRR